MALSLRASRRGELKMTRVAYICDGKRHCSNFKNCQTICKHTFDRFHTANGIIHDVKELETARFRKICVSDEVSYYEEVVKM